MERTIINVVLLKSLKYSSLFLVFCNIVYLFWVGINSSVLVPDELWFWDIIQRNYNNLMNKKMSILDIPNDLNYGQIWWIFVTLIHNVTIVRMISICSLLITLIFTIKINVSIWGGGGGDKNIKYIIILLWMASPVAWFSGKILGPELLSMSIGTLGLFVFLRKLKQSDSISLLSVFLVSLSVGIKLNNIVFYAFILIYLLINSKEKYKKIRFLFKIFAYCGIFIIVYIICNPIVITNNNTYMQNASIGSGLSLKYFMNVLFDYRFEWDMIFSGGLFNNLISIYMFLVLFLGCLCKKNFKVIMIIVYTVLFGLIISSQQRFLGWYLFPLIPIIYCLIGGYRTDTKLKKMILTFGIIINFVTLLPANFTQISYKLNQINQSRNREQVYEKVTELEKYVNNITNYNKVYLTGFDLLDKSYNYSQYERLMNLEPMTVYFINCRMATNESINDKIVQANKGENNMSIPYYDNDFLVLIKD